MNRRSFMKASSVAGLGSLALTPEANHFASAQSPAYFDPTLLSGATSCHSVGSGNVYAGNPQAQDWNNVGSVMLNILTAMQSNGADAALKPLYEQVNPNGFALTQMDAASVLQQLQIYQPTATAATVAAQLNAVTQDAATVTNVL